MESHMLARARLVGAALGAAAAGAILTAPSALAAPPNCTAADLAGVSAGVSAATSAYLFTRPEVNAFFTGLEGSPRDELRTQIQQYLDANPQVKAELAGIRQPLVDLRNRCGGADTLPNDNLPDDTP
jgi:hemophore-related protein